MSGSAGADALAPDALLEVVVRASVELGRARMPLGRAEALADGAIVDLDRTADAPVDLYVNGRRHATGRLVVVDGEWVLCVDHVLDAPAGPALRQVSRGPSDH
jgi:flagellar motor switch protein FliN/FliY